VTKRNKSQKTPECEEGPKARENFERAMKSLFQAPKVDIKKTKKGKD
jgi:hypothetical protein